MSDGSGFTGIGSEALAGKMEMVEEEKLKRILRDISNTPNEEVNKYIFRKKVFKLFGINTFFSFLALILLGGDTINASKGIVEGLFYYTLFSLSLQIVLFLLIKDTEMSNRKYNIYRLFRALCLCDDGELEEAKEVAIDALGKLDAPHGRNTLKRYINHVSSTDASRDSKRLEIKRIILNRLTEELDCIFMEKNMSGTSSPDKESVYPRWGDVSNKRLVADAINRNLGSDVDWSFVFIIGSLMLIMHILFGANVAAAVGVFLGVVERYAL